MRSFFPVETSVAKGVPCGPVTCKPLCGRGRGRFPDTRPCRGRIRGDPGRGAGGDPTGLDGIIQYTYAPGTGSNSCPTGDNSVGLISVDSCLDTTDIEDSVLASVSGLGGLNGPVYDWGTAFYAQGTASAGSDPVPANSAPDTGNNVVGSNYSSIVSLSATTNLPTIYFGGLLGGVAGPAGAFVGGLLGSMCGVGLNFSLVPSTGSFYVGPVGTCGAGVNAGSGFQVTDVEVPSLQDPNRIANGLSTSVTKVLPFSGNPGSTAVGGTAVTSPGSGPTVYGPVFGNRTPVSVSVGYNICLLNCAFR